MGGVATALPFMVCPWAERRHRYDGGVVVAVVRIGVERVVEGAHDRADLLEQHASVLWPQVRIAARGIGHELIERPRDPRQARRGRRDVVVDVLVRHRERGVAAVRSLPGQHLEQQDPRGVDVGPRTSDATLDLLGGEVRDRADEDPAGSGARGDRRRGRDGARQPEVRHLDASVIGEQHVLRLHVPMDEPGVVGRSQRGDDRLEDDQRGARIEVATPAEQVAKRAPLDVLHRQVDGAVVVTLVVDRNHVGVGQPGS